MSRVQRLELLVFIATFFAFAYFHQGGGWNQNSRFAEVRAIVEQGRFAIDDFLIYQRDAASGVLRRIPTRAAEYEIGGRHHRLAWVDMAWTLFPINESPAAEGVKLAPMIELCSSGDLGYVPHTGHFHPNKPPGTSFLGVPAYFIAYHVERALGMNPDAWWTLTLNAWITTIGSIGLISALACVLFFRLAREFAGGALFPAAAATLAFAFGTTFFPFATLFFDHAATGSLLFAALYFVRRKSAGALLLAGACAGLAAITNYLAAVPVAFLAAYALLARLDGTASKADFRRTAIYLAGVLPFLILICWYNAVNFGSPTRLANDFQSPLFKDTGAFLGMFVLPSSYVAGLITVSPYRGIFFLSPVLIMAAWSLVAWLADKARSAEARLCLAIFGFFFLVNISFNGYHGGFSAGPRYLVPGLPFLALPLVVAFARWRWCPSRTSSSSRRQTRRTRSPSVATRATTGGRTFRTISSATTPGRSLPTGARGRCSISCWVCIWKRRKRSLKRPVSIPTSASVASGKCAATCTKAWCEGRRVRFCSVRSRVP